MKSRWIAVLFILLFFVFLIDALSGVDLPLFNPSSFQLDSKLIYIVLSSAGIGALLLFLLIAFFPPRSRQPGTAGTPAASKRTRRITQLQTALQLGLRSRIEDLFSAMHEEDPDYWLAKKIEGDLHAEKGEWSEASRAYRDALQHCAGEDQALLQLCLGNVYEQQDLPDQAKSLYLQALQNSPRAEELVLRLRNLAVREQNWDEAMKWQETTEQLQSRDTESPQEENWRIGIRFEIARDAANSGNIKVAQALLKNIFRGTAYFTPAYLLQGEMQSKQHSPLAGLKTYEQGFAATQNPVILKRIGESFLLENQPDRAIDYFRELTRTHPEDPRVAFCLGDLFVKLEMTSEAMKVFESVRRRHPDWLLNNFALAEIYARKGETEKALQLYKGIVDHSETLSVQPWQCYDCHTTYSEYRDLCVVCFVWNSVNLNQNKAGIMDFGYEKSTALPL